MMNLTCFDSFPELETKRLLLRKILPQDADAIFEIRKNTLVHSFIYRPLQTEKQQASDLIERVETAYRNQQNLAWAAIHKSSGRLLATCGFNSIQTPNRRAEIGGEMHPDFWRKNLAQEGFEAILGYGFDVMKLNTIEAKVIAENRSTIALLEKYGFEKEAHLKEFGFYKDKAFDLLIYTMHANKRN